MFDCWRSVVGFGWEQSVTFKTAVGVVGRTFVRSGDVTDVTGKMLGFDLTGRRGSCIVLHMEEAPPRERETMNEDNDNSREPAWDACYTCGVPAPLTDGICIVCEKPEWFEDK